MRRHIQTFKLNLTYTSVEGDAHGLGDGVHVELLAPAGNERHGLVLERRAGHGHGGGGLPDGPLEEALKAAVPAVRVPCPPLEDGGPERYARWGEQLDVRNITKDSEQAGELSAEQVAGYIAKYATKATESFGAGLDRRLATADELEHLDPAAGPCG